MRKTITLSTFVLDAATKVRSDGPMRAALERRLGETPATSESSALRQLAEVGARVLTEDASEHGYSELAAILGEEPRPEKVQNELGAPIEGEEDSQFDALFRALDEKV